MVKSRVIKNLLGAQEKVIKEFGISLRYRYFKFFLTIFQWLLGLGLIFALFIFLSTSSRPDFSQVGRFGDSPYDTGINAPTINFGAYLEIGEEAMSIILIGLVLIFVFFVVPLNLFYYFFLLRINYEFMLTDQRVIVKRGWLNIQTVSIQYARITDVSIAQSIIGRLLKIGALSISTAGNEGNRVIMAHIEDPQGVKRLLHELKEKYRQSFGGSTDIEAVDSVD